MKADVRTTKELNSGCQVFNRAFVCAAKNTAVTTADPWPLERLYQDAVTPTRAILRADNERGVITLDEQTSLQGVPTQAWEYRLGNRSALEWVLDQYKERKPRDPTIRERFNTYRFADHKERVVDLLGRVCAVSTFTTTIVKELGTRSSIERT